MSSKTKIVVLHMKEIIYTVIFAILAILLILLLVFMFSPGSRKSSGGEKYKAGVYTSSLTLNNTDLEVEVSVDETGIRSIRFSNLDETAAAMLPLAQPAMEEIAEQICSSQSLDNLQFSEDSPYTSQVIVDAISKALEKAEK